MSYSWLLHFGTALLTSLSCINRLPFRLLLLNPYLGGETYIREPSTSFKPTDVVYHEEDDSDNTALYIIDWGNSLPPTVPNTGIVWKITHTGDGNTAAADALGNFSLDDDVNTDIQLLPPIESMRDIAIQIAVTVGLQAQQDGVAQAMSEQELRELVQQRFWTPQYFFYKHI